MLRCVATVLCGLCLLFLAAGIASATTFIDLSAMSGYQATPMGIYGNGAVVTETSTISGTSGQYNYPYFYSGGTAGTYTNISSKFLQFC